MRVFVVYSHFYFLCIFSFIVFVSQILLVFIDYDSLFDVYSFDILSISYVL